MFFVHMLVMTQLRMLCNGLDICQRLFHDDIDSRDFSSTERKVFPVPFVGQPLALFKMPSRLLTTGGLTIIGSDATVLWNNTWCDKLH